MKTPQEIIEARWPRWIEDHEIMGCMGSRIPLMEIIAEAQREALEFAAKTADFEDDSDEVARICRAKAAAI